MRAPLSAALRLFWVASAILLGATLGLPWAWLLVGSLPALVFAALSGAIAVRQLASWPASHASKRRWLANGLLGGAVGGLVAGLFGRVETYTWIDIPSRGCFSLTGKPIVFFGEDTTFAWTVTVVATGFVLSAGAALLLYWRFRWYARAPEKLERSLRAAEVSAIACLLAARLWSAANDTLNFDLTSHTRDPCNPDLGLVAVMGYLAAAFGFALQFAYGPRPKMFVGRVSATSPYRESASSGPGEDTAKRARIRAAIAGVGLTLALGAGAAQTVQSVALAGSSSEGCGCNKSGRPGWNNPPRGAASAAPVHELRGLPGAP